MFSTDYIISYFCIQNKCSSCFSAIHLPPVEEGEILLYFVKKIGLQIDKCTIFCYNNVQRKEELQCR